MNTDDEVFAIALDLPAAEREAYLAQACARDPAMRQRIAALLASFTPALSFLEKSAVIRPTFPPESDTSEVIDRYVLCEKIGEGGCGVVYRAEQLHPIRRTVALKVIKLGMDTRAVIARFEAERQALALMDHPHIARVLDAGATESGRPFFVMELVSGVPITRFCDENQLSTRERLGLFVQVCEAIQHAHDRGVIHRDIKPSNILVTLTGPDHAPVSKIIDFGIAKATQGRLTEQTLVTVVDQIMGTPAYMSPEQADLSGPKLDARSDIYSLGILLYELLTGRPPFDEAQLKSTAVTELRRILQEQDPLRPSLRLSRVAAPDLSTIARQRGAAPPQLAAALRGELDWIVMRAIQKCRTQRYQSAAAFAADVQRHLRHEPVLARPPSPIYRTVRFLRRKRAPALALGAIILIAGLSTAAIAWQIARAEQAERNHAALRAAQLLTGENPTAAEIAETTIATPAEAEHFVATLRNDFEFKGPGFEQEMLIERKAQHVVSYFDHLPEEKRTAEIAQQRALVLIRQALAAWRQSNGNGRVLLARAVGVAEQLPRDQPENQALLALALMAQSDSSAARNATSRSNEQLAQAEALLRPLVAADDSGKYRRQLARVRLLQGRRANLASRRPILVEAESLLTSLGALERNDARDLAQLAHIQASRLALERGTPAETLVQQVLALAARALHVAPANTDALQARATVATEMSRRQGLAGSPEISATWLAMADQSWLTLLRADPSNWNAQYWLISARRERMLALIDHGKLSEAAALGQALLDLAAKLPRENYMMRTVVALLAELAANRGDISGSRALAEKKSTYFSGGWTASGASAPMNAQRAALIYRNEARQLLLLSGRYQEAITDATGMLDEIAAILKSPLATVTDAQLSEPLIDTARFHLAKAHVLLTRYDEAERVLRSKGSDLMLLNFDERCWLAFAVLRQGRNEDALKITPTLFFQSNTYRFTAPGLRHRESAARALLVDALAQPDTTAGRWRRHEALTQAAERLNTITAEAKQLHDIRILRGWITEAQANLASAPTFIEAKRH